MANPWLRLDLPEPEPLGSARIISVRLVFVELVVVAQSYIVEAALQHPRLEVRLAHLVLARLQSWHHPVRHEYVHVGFTRRRHRTCSKYRSVRHQRHAHPDVADIDWLIIYLEAVC